MISCILERKDDHLKALSQSIHFLGDKIVSKFKKCHLLVLYSKLLGLVVCKTSMITNLNKIKVINELQSPKDIGFRGHINYTHKFIKNSQGYHIHQMVVIRLGIPLGLAVEDELGRVRVGMLH